MKIDVKEKNEAGQLFKQNKYRLIRIPQKIDLGLPRIMTQIVMALRDDIRANRLSKVRTGTKHVRVPGTKRYVRSSGPPQYPHVLSVLTGRLRNSIVYDVLVDKALSKVFGRVGTNVEYAGKFERKIGDQWHPRAFLGPALRDMTQRINRQKIDDRIRQMIKDASK